MADPGFANGGHGRAPKARGSRRRVAKRRRRDYRGAEGAEGMGFGQGCHPPQWGGVWGGGIAPPQKIFRF